MQISENLKSDEGLGYDYNRITAVILYVYTISSNKFSSLLIQL